MKLASTASSRGVDDVERDSQRHDVANDYDDDDDDIEIRVDDDSSEEDIACDDDEDDEEYGDACSDVVNSKHSPNGDKVSRSISGVDFFKNMPRETENETHKKRQNASELSSTDCDVAHVKVTSAEKQFDVYGKHHQNSDVANYWLHLTKWYSSHFGFTPAMFPYANPLALCHAANTTASPSSSSSSLDMAYRSDSKADNTKTVNSEPCSPLPPRTSPNLSSPSAAMCSRFSLVQHQRATSEQSMTREPGEIVHPATHDVTPRCLKQNHSINHKTAGPLQHSVSPGGALAGAVSPRDMLVGDERMREFPGGFPFFLPGNPLPPGLRLATPRPHHPLLPGLAPPYGAPFLPPGLFPPAHPASAAVTVTRRPRDPNKPPPVKKYKCDLCGKAFSRSNTLVTHRRIHTGEKPFKCEICSRAFRQPGNLTRHRLTHTSVKPYVCVVCKKAFNRASNLHTHMRTHTSFRPFVCSCCGKGFQQKVDLKIHMYTHSNRS